jgi:putative NIF3 family GTP cyclohydrolase 1 type 2
VRSAVGFRQQIDRQKLTQNCSLTTSVLSEALTNDTSVIVSYHPPIFKGLQSLTLSNPLQASLLQCAALGISVYSPHTALDSIRGGVNDWLATGILEGDNEAGTVRSLAGGGDVIDDGEVGRLVTLNSSIGMGVLERRIKTHLNLSQSEWKQCFATSSIADTPRQIKFKSGMRVRLVRHRILGPLPSALSLSVLVRAGPCLRVSRPMYILREKCRT